MASVDANFYQKSGTRFLLAKFYFIFKNSSTTLSDLKAFCGCYFYSGGGSPVRNNITNHIIKYPKLFLLCFVRYFGHGAHPWGRNKPHFIYCTFDVSKRIMQKTATIIFTCIRHSLLDIFSVVLSILHSLCLASNP